MLALPRRLLALAVSLLALTTLASCAEGPFDPELDDLLGTYHLQQFYIVVGSDSTDFVARGATVNLVLADSGRASGTMSLPITGQPNLVIDLAGTWEFVGRKIALAHAEETFLNGALLTVPGPGQIDLVDDEAGQRFVFRLRRE